MYWQQFKSATKLPLYSSHFCSVYYMFTFHCLCLFKNIFHKCGPLVFKEIEHTLTLEICIFQISPYKRVNVTYALYVYEGATFELPTATVEFRVPLDQTGWPGDNCPSSFLISSTRTIWGQLTANNAHILIGTGDFK